jgi:anaerobic ribonucleoside-triphosphate reductase activating protein
MCSPDGGTRWPISYLFQRIISHSPFLEGVTIGGGEPFDQQAALAPLLQRLKQETTLSCLLCTWYPWEHLQQPAYAPLLNLVDVLYTPAPAATSHVRGNECSPQHIHVLTNRYASDDLRALPHAEVTITVDGNVITSGLWPYEWP